VRCVGLTHHQKENCDGGGGNEDKYGVEEEKTREENTRKMVEKRTG
jgi:hypothetical protein